MKKSLIIRWIIILVVVAGWTLSMFPIRDRSFLKQFNEMAAPQLAKLTEEAKGIEGSLDDAKAKLATMDPDSAEYKKLKKQCDAKDALDDFEELTSRINDILTKTPNYSEFKAVEQAANGDADHYRISLAPYIQTTFYKNLSNRSALYYVRKCSAGKLRLGLDLQGGTEFIVGFDPDKVPSNESNISIRDRIIEILRTRVDKMGVAEPEIKAVNETSISVRMPSVDEADKTDIRNTIRQAAKLTFHLVAENNAQLVSAYNADRKNFRTPAELLRTEIMEGDEDNPTTSVIFIQREPEKIRGNDVARAVASFDQFGKHSINLRFNSRGSQAFADVTGANVGRRLAIVLDGKVYSAPNIREAISGGSAEITGNFTAQEAVRLAGVIASGNLPVSIEITSEFGTDPTLGADSIRSGMMAGVIGLIVVILFMLWIYKFAGFVAVIALLVNTLLVFGSMAVSKATITMPGLAGMVLTIGMTVDANVLIFERIREELQRGKNLASAVSLGYSKVYSAIIDSNLTTLITCGFLSFFGTGSVKGFAVTLTYGIFASLFTALFMTHTIFDSMVHNNWLSTLNMRTIWSGEKKINFLSYMRPSCILAIIMVVISVLTMFVRNNNLLGIDFAGGTLFSYECNGQNPDVENVRAYLQKVGYESVKVGYKRGQGGEEQLEVTLPDINEKTNDVFDATAFSTQLDQAFPECKIRLTSTYNVGGAVGSLFLRSAIMAAGLSFLGIIIYLSFRFEFLYGLAAVIAVIHDAIVSVGLFFLFHNGQLSLTVVAAIMTIIGYSLNDTIVIFDRVRETRLNQLKTSVTYKEIVNQALNDTLSRTMLTTITTMLAVISLIIFGGGVIRDFAVVMFYGMISGTFSSLFISTAIVCKYHKPTLAEQKLMKQYQNRSNAATI